MAILSAFRKAPLAFIAGLLLFVFPKIPQAQIPLDTVQDTLSRYNSYSRLHYQIQSSEFSGEILPFEKYLNHLLQSVNYHLRSFENIDLDDEDILSSQQITQEVYYSIESDLGNFFARKHDIWKQYQYREMYLQLDRALRIKQRLFDESDGAGKKKMFDYDLNAAVQSMGDGELEFAIKLFTHLMDFYKHTNYDDLLYYRSEAYYRLKQFASACSGFQRVMEQFPQSEYYEMSYYRCLTLDYSRADYAGVIDASSVFEERKDSWKSKTDVILFTMGSSHFNSGDYDRAISYFSQIAAKSPYFNKAQYLAAHCLLYKEEYVAAKEAITNILDDTEAKGLTGEESALILGDMILFEGNQDAAWGYYHLIPKKSSRYPRALIGKAVCRIIREEYSIADSLADYVLHTYKDNDYVYIARCLKGKILRSMDEGDLAALQYDTILRESGIKIGLADFLTEKLRIVYLLNELRKNEANYLESGDEDLFNWYWSLRHETEVMLKRAIFSEVSEVYPEFRGIAAEKITVMGMLEEYVDIRDQVMATEDEELINHYSAVMDTLNRVASMVHYAGYGRISKLPNYFKYTDFEFNRQKLDSLYQSVTYELSQVESDLEAASRALDTAGESISPLDRAEMIAKVESISQWRKALDNRVSSSFDKLKASPELDLTSWSHIAFHKTMVPGSDFDDLKVKQKRIKNIDFYLQALGTVRSQIESGQTETTDQ